MLINYHKSKKQILKTKVILLIHSLIIITLFFFKKSFLIYN
ncbi:hypothetical protein HMPREF9074_07629 [Capnocytophaga sp. oral taxon 329 str. F0087]|nr:hypothetical protein HMPREF9074_07629 [Capnocytophaga sp. oral taxon 329 str. F0087]